MMEIYRCLECSREFPVGPSGNTAIVYDFARQHVANKHHKVGRDVDQALQVIEIRIPALANVAKGEGDD